MPTYEFRCPDGTIIERFFRISEVPESIPSPDGNGTAVRIISGGGGLIFKGSGFYITDYGKDGKKDQREAAAKSSESSNAGSGSSSSGSANGSGSTSAGVSSASIPSASSGGSASSGSSSGSGGATGSTSGGSTSSAKSE